MREPQKVKFFIKEEAKRKPCYVGKKYRWSLKKDGWYGYIEFTHGQITPKVFTKTGKEVITLQDQVRRHRDSWDKMVKESMLRNGRFIFEIRDFYDKAKNVYEMNSILKKEKIQQEATYFIHDILDYENPKTTAKERAVYLELSNRNARIAWAHTHSEWLKPLLITSDIEKVMELYRELTALGEEGIVGIAEDSIYEWGARNGDLLKLKAETFVKGCIIQRRVPGEGNGSIEVRLPSGILQQVAGIDNDKDKRWTKEYITGKSVDLVCMQVTPSGKLREPRLWECKI
jgi:hypothetical protein